MIGKLVILLSILSVTLTAEYHYISVTTGSNYVPNSRGYFVLRFNSVPGFKWEQHVNMPARGILPVILPNTTGKAVVQLPGSPFTIDSLDIKYYATYTITRQKDVYVTVKNVTDSTSKTAFCLTDKLVTHAGFKRMHAC
jgi:hypothetical protein